MQRLDPVGTRLKWSHPNGEWVGICGKFRVEITGPSPPLGFYFWQVWNAQKREGSGGCQLISAAKRSAEKEIKRILDKGQK